MSGFLAQVDRTMISEVPIDLDVLIPLLEADKRSNPENYSMCVLSEGATIKGDEGPGEEIGKSASDRTEEGIGQRLARDVSSRTGQGTIVQELAYLMRSGAPDAVDRMVGFAFGALAVQLLQSGHAGRMVALKGGNYAHVPIATLLEQRKSVDVAALYDPRTYRASLVGIEGMPMLLY
jgi:6-phosphofructokinase 1